ncbi:hypothetical protein [Shewanella sp. AC91-MNA-CIBAN-0169]|jgi:hypothetical protein|uniref:hypothetical protein n=1 Tax=Shewanella sp. AC91-MNA-CIBAN-0169 TaxID=3140466 RepID=UPI00331ACAA5|tara:strand:- start:1134 stop:1580 length:447 start_codon:yes stop_codon:yes gene_type:complete
MNVIRSVSEQWHKAEFAHQLHIYLSQEQVINDLFVGATNKATICNIIAAMIESPIKLHDEKYKIDQNSIFDCFFQCFHLLFIKEVEHHSLTQAEQLILSISVYFANKINQQPDSVDISDLQKSAHIITAMSRLEIVRKEHRKSQCNMG